MFRSLVVGAWLKQQWRRIDRENSNCCSDRDLTESQSKNLLEMQLLLLKGDVEPLVHSARYLEHSWSLHVLPEMAIELQNEELLSMLECDLRGPY